MTRIIIDVDMTVDAALKAGLAVFKGKDASPNSAGKGEYWPTTTGKTHHIHNEPGVAVTAKKKTE